MPCQRIVALLAGLGLTICKRQGVGLLTAKLDSFRAEDEAVLRAGLAGAAFVTVDDTGARHAGKGCFTTPIGADRFAVFRTGPGKSRLAFLRRLLGGAARYGINAAAIAYMGGANLPQDVVDRLAGMLRGTWLARGMDGSFARARPCRLAGYAPKRRARLAKRRCGAQSRPKVCSRTRSSYPTTPASSASATTRCAFVHAERLVHKLVSANDGQRNAVAVAKRMIWWFYRRLKPYKLAPSPQQASLLRSQFDRMFKRRPATPPSIIC